MKDFKDKMVAVLGWGIDTRDVVPWLLAQGAKVTVIDKKTETELGDMGKLEDRGKIEWKLGKEGFGDLSGFEVIVRSPGVYRFRKEIIEAEKAGVEISSKTKIFFDVCPAKIIGVTGTKGKGTTTTLIYEMLRAEGKRVILGGNVGLGVFGELGGLGENDWVVLELSSFQLIDLRKSPHIAVVLMTTSEHLDWHADTKEYIEAKTNIVSHQGPGDFAVVNKDYSNSREIGSAAGGKIVWVSKEALTKMKDEEIGLRGEHNRENIVAASTAAMLAGVSEENIRKVIREFKGLEHRLEEVAVVDGATYYNDTFSTVPETAIAAIKAFKEPKIVILGGSEKGSDFTELGKTIAECGNVKAVILIGKMAGRIEKAIIESIEKREKRRGEKVEKIEIIKGAKNMEEIVKMAYNRAVFGDVVLLSPACASFDMFPNYKERGKQFKKEVLKLKGIRIT